MWVGRFLSVIWVTVDEIKLLKSFSFHVGAECSGHWKLKKFFLQLKKLMGTMVFFTVLDTIRHLICLNLEADVNQAEMLWGQSRALSSDKIWIGFALRLRNSAWSLKWACKLVLSIHIAITRYISWQQVICLLLQKSPLKIFRWCQLFWKLLEMVWTISNISIHLWN